MQKRVALIDDLDAHRSSWHTKRVDHTTTGGAILRRQNLLFIPLRPTKYYYYYDNMSTPNDDSGPIPEALDPSELQLARNDRGGKTRFLGPCS